MEELVSTEALDREILEDARKKAHRILKTADDTLDTQKQDWDNKTQKILAEVGQTYDEQAGKIKEEIFARFPLDKRRMRFEIIESFLCKAMDDFLRSLSREKLFSVLIGELSPRLVILDSEKTGGGKPELLYSGMSLSEICTVLKKAHSSLDSQALSLKEDSQVHEFPSVVINTQTLKINASVENAARALLKEKRAELVTALFGEEVLND